MLDAWHLWGGGLRLSATGDLLTVEGPELGRQRVIRRLLSNPGGGDAAPDLLFHPEYGGGLPAKVGETTSPAVIGTAVRRQLFLEAAVAREPPPQVRAVPVFGGVNVRVSYTDAETGEAAVAGFTVEG